MTVMCFDCCSCFITNVYAGLGGVIGPCIVSIIVAGLLVSLTFRLQVLWRSYDDIYCDQTNSKGDNNRLVLRNLLTIDYRCLLEHLSDYAFSILT